MFHKLLLSEVHVFKIEPGNVELNPPVRLAVLKVPDSFYTQKLLTTKIYDYGKEIGFCYG